MSYEKVFKKTLLLILAAHLCAGQAMSFTQGAGVRGTGGTPQGHEWLTMRSAMEVLGDESGSEPNDPREKPLPNGQPFPRAQNPTVPGNLINEFKQQRVDDKTYGSKYKKVFDAILGQRWVDIGGVNVVKAQSASINCFDAVPQLPDDIQQDHFLRERAQGGGQGAVQAIDDSTQRFIRYFVAAATAPQGTLKAWDGGGYSVKVDVDRNYFLFGRAIHLLQDSFSADHTVRDLQDGYKMLRGIKTYLCTLHSDQHSHVRPFSFDPNLDYEKVGDIIWRSRQNDWTPVNVKLNALTSVEAMKDAWASFIRIMALPQAQRQATAQSEAQRIAGTWLSYNRQEVIDRYDDPDAWKKIPTFVRDQAACDQTIGGAGHMERTAANRKTCIWNMIAIDGTTERDTSMHHYYRWDWKNQFKFETPPANFDPTREPRVQ
jgi:hypothetical protein